MSAIAHDYQYLYPSTLTADTGSPTLRLATSDAGGRSHPYFFDGRVREPRLVAELLTAVHLVVGSRFFTPANTVAKLIALTDPVVTSGGGLLRFEGFSACCSTYARVDLLPGIYEGDVVGKGPGDDESRVVLNAVLGGQGARIRKALLG